MRVRFDACHGGPGLTALVSTAVVGAVALAAATIAQAQTPSQAAAAGRSFVVASVKPNRVNIENLPPLERLGATLEGLRGNIRTSGGRLTAFRATLRELMLYAFELREYQLERGTPVVRDAPVVDRTGLTGMLDFTIGFTPARRADPGIESAFPPIQGALQQQLGLKLETEPGPVNVLIVDAAGQPTPN